MSGGERGDEGAYGEEVWSAGGVDRGRGGSVWE